jgi:uncharacterized membrane protein YidH (DUF202 family)
MRIAGMARHLGILQHLFVHKTAMHRPPNAATLDARRDAIRERRLAAWRATACALLSIGVACMLVNGLADGQLKLPLRAFERDVAFADHPYGFALLALVYAGLSALAGLSAILLVRRRAWIR